MTTRSHDHPVTSSDRASRGAAIPTDTWRNLREAKRRRVLDAAMAEFGRHGFSSASLNVVAREAGVAKGSLFVYFDDKLDLYAHVCETCSARIREVMAEAIARHAARTSGLFPLLRAAALDWVAYFADHPLERGVTLATNFEIDPEVRRAVRAVVNRHYVDVLRPMITAAAEAGELREDGDPEHLLALLVLLLPHLALAPTTPELDPVLGLHGATGEALREPVHALLGVAERAFAADPATSASTAAGRLTATSAAVPLRSPA
jgi:AcrR family transcriptional regulator